MCAGAAWAARIGLIVFGAADPKAGASGSLYNFAADPRLNHESVVVAGVRAEECAALLVRLAIVREPALLQNRLEQIVMIFGEQIVESSPEVPQEPVA